MSFTQHTDRTHQTVTCVRCRLTRRFVRGDLALVAWKRRHTCRPAKERAA